MTAPYSISMQRSYEIFSESIRSEAAKKTYKLWLEKFLKFSKLKDYDSLAATPPKLLEQIIIDYVISLKRSYEHGDIGPNAFSQRLSPIELFMVQNDILLNFKKIKKMFPRKIKEKGDTPYSRPDLQLMISAGTSARSKTIIASLSSTGARPEAMIGLTMQDIKEMDGDCMSILFYKNDPEEYPGFLTPEATKYLRDYFKDREFHGEKLNENSPVFRNKYRQTMAWHNVQPLTLKGLRHIVNKILLKSKVRVKTHSAKSRHEKALFGGFRKWFETTLNNNNQINSNVVEKLMGHRNDLRGTYYNPTIDVRFENFKLAIADLTISDIMRKDVEIQKHKNIRDSEMRKIIDEAILDKLDGRIDKRLLQITNEELEKRIQDILDRQKR